MLQGEGNAQADAAGIIGEPQQPKPAKDGTEAGGTKELGAGSGAGWAFTVAIGEAQQLRLRSAEDGTKAGGTMALGAGSGPGWVLIVALRLAAAGFLMLCALLVAYSADLSCCAVDREKKLTSALEPYVYGLVYTCLYVAFTQDALVLVIGLDVLIGRRVLITTAFGIFYIWLIDQTMLVCLIFAVFKLAWKEADSKCTSLCMPIFAGAGVGVSWLTAFAILCGLSWKSMKPLASKSVNRFRAQSPYAS